MPSGLSQSGAVTGPDDALTGLGLYGALFPLVTTGPGSHGLVPGILGPTDRSRRERRWLGYRHPCLQPLGPTDALIAYAQCFRMISSRCGAPLRNRTVDLLLTMENHSQFDLVLRSNI